MNAASLSPSLSPAANDEEEEGDLTMASEYSSLASVNLLLDGDDEDALEEEHEDEEDEGADDKDGEEIDADEEVELAPEASMPPPTCVSKVTFIHAALPLHSFSWKYKERCPTALITLCTTSTTMNIKRWAQVTNLLKNSGNHYDSIKSELLEYFLGKVQSCRRVSILHR